MNVSLLEKIPSPWAERFQTVTEEASRLRQPVVLVGGCVRDLLLNRTPLDWDIMVEGEADSFVQSLATQFSAKVVRHPSFLTATLHFSDATSLDVATARQEKYPHPASLPVVHPATLREDFRRRDFTVNALALDLSAGSTRGSLMDPLNGIEDLHAGVIRVLHPQSFQDDPTRLFRAARYAGRYHWNVHPETQKLISLAIHDQSPQRLSAARRRNELIHVLQESDPSPALTLCWEWGLWPVWSPHWKWPGKWRFPKAQTTDSLLSDRLRQFCQCVYSHWPEDKRESRFKRDLQALVFPRALSKLFPRE